MGTPEPRTAIAAELPAAPAPSAALRPVSPLPALGGGGLGNQTEVRQHLGQPLVLPDTVAEAGLGQMRKTEFLSQLQERVTATAQERLAPAGRSTEDCPYLAFWFPYYEAKSSRHLDRAIRRFAPEAGRAGDASAAIELLSVRVGSSVSHWVETGEVSGLPQGLGGQGGVPLRTLPGKVGEGKPLDTRTRSQMESVLGRDFSDVRVHTEGAAAAYARGMQARAVTMGEEIAFDAGQYQPGTPVGDAILAHELAHVAQQQGSSGASNEPLSAAERPGPEREADAATLSAVAALWGGERTGAERFARRRPLSSRSGLALQRCSYEVSHPPHTFKSCGFGASGSGALRVSDNPATGKADIESQTYQASGKVSIAGGTDDQAKDWEAGFMQTNYDSEIKADYHNAAGVHHVYRVVAVPGAKRDGDTGVIPWYGAETVRPFTSTNSSVKPAMDDTPITRPPWVSSDGAGVLKAQTGQDRFCSWMMVRQKSSGDIVYLNWATWEIDWGASLDPVTKTGSGTGAGTRVTGKGTGKGSIVPQTGDPTANDALTVNWVP